MDNLQRATEQLDRAAAVTPGEPVLVVTRAYSEYLAGAPRTTSLPAVSQALQGPAQDTINLQVGQVLLDSAGHFDDSLQLFQGWARLDPGNLLILDRYASELLCTRRPREALQIFDIMNARSVQDIFLPARGRVLFAYSGRTRELRSALDAVPQLPSDYRIWFEFDALRFEHRYEELLHLLTRTSVQRLVPPPENYSFLVGVPAPVAELRGWAALLAGDSAAAQATGAELAAVVAEAHTSEVGAWYLATLNAEANLLAGARTAAIADARRSLALRPRTKDALAWREVALRNARVLAWAGAQDEAVALLETLSSGDNGLGPAEITRDPLYERPLADNPRYGRLRTRLEAVIGATRLE
jgi:hypothetical protein